MITYVVPMAGSGHRFSEEGWRLPKPLIPTAGGPMGMVSVACLRADGEHRFVFLCQRKHIEEYDLGEYAQLWGGPGTVVIPVDGVTQGAACTVLLAADEIRPDEPLVIANCDQWFRSTSVGITEFTDLLGNPECDGVILTMRVKDESRKWSYVRVEECKQINDTFYRNFVTEVAEKRPISDQATVGVYGFRKGSDFVRAASEMIAADERVGGEFYVAPVYNRLIREGKKIIAYPVGDLGESVRSLGTPEDLAKFNAWAQSEEKS